MLRWGLRSSLLIRDNIKEVSGREVCSAEGAERQCAWHAVHKLPYTVCAEAVATGCQRAPVQGVQADGAGLRIIPLGH